MPDTPYQLVDVPRDLKEHILRSEGAEQRLRFCILLLKGMRI
jgi:hypothetical protein